MIGSTSRMLALLSLLQTQRDWPGRVLADRLAVSPRTVRRDVDRLRELGYRIGAIKGPDGGYRLAAGSELPPLLFDDEQAVAIAVALQNAASAGVDIDEAALRALATVRQVMPSRLRHRIDGISFTGSPADTSTRFDPAVLETVSVAVRDRRTVRFDYTRESGRSESSSSDPPRRAEPQAIVSRGGRWYLIAWDLDRDDWRIFRLDRLHPRTPMGPRFTPRPLPAPDADLAGSGAAGSDVDRWPCIGEVIIDLPAREVAPWIGDGDVEVLTERSCRLTVGAWSWIGVLAQVTRHDAPFTIVGPDALVTASAVLAERMRESVPQKSAPENPSS
jgi:predicted DNA-binding transcriptional regulator YafY